jgi:hypothetical protein
MARGAGRPPPARAELFEIGCVPYKSGKMWAPLMDRFGTYYRTLRMLKRSFDPKSLFCPDNLGH